MLIAALLLVQTAPACAARDTNLPPALAGWTTPGDSFEPGRPVVLVPTDGAVQIGFRVVEAGTYGIAIDQPGWIDVQPGPPQPGPPLASVGHGHGPECSTIRKIVRFALEPGIHIVSLKRLSGPVKVMLVKSKAE